MKKTQQNIHELLKKEEFNFFKQHQKQKNMSLFHVVIIYCILLLGFFLIFPDLFSPSYSNCFELPLENTQTKNSISSIDLTNKLKNFDPLVP